MPRRPPIRTCIACGATSDKRGLVRIVRTPDAQVLCDPSGRKAGRGAYLCQDKACFEKARKKRLFDARLKCKVSEQDYARLEEEFAEACSLAEQARLQG